MIHIVSTLTRPTFIGEYCCCSYQDQSLGLCANSARMYEEWSCGVDIDNVRQPRSQALLPNKGVSNSGSGCESSGH